MLTDDLILSEGGSLAWRVPDWKEVQLRKLASGTVPKLAELLSPTTTLNNLESNILSFFSFSSISLHKRHIHFYLNGLFNSS